MIKRTAFYIAGKYTSKDRLMTERNWLRCNMFDSETSWLDETWDSDNGVPVHISITNAMRDQKEVQRADILILDTIDDSMTGGREVELGMALALGKPTIIVGPRRNIFHYVAAMHYPDWDSLKAYLSGTNVRMAW